MNSSTHILPMQLAPARIATLPEALANQIAAGEVVERPASVIKELLENSIDAGATAIDIEIEEGGAKLIRIRDNGCGIERDDLFLALSRHATSKIRTQEDLWHISSFGFRGEALASIGAVAQVTLISRPAKADMAWKISINAGDLAAAQKSLSPVAHPQGTTIDVRDIFANVPARRKFLRSAQTEFSHIAEVVRRFALTHFNISIALSHNHKKFFVFPALATEHDLTSRLEKIFGIDFVRAALEISAQSCDISINGWVAKPTFTRSQADMQYFYVNGRSVRDKTLAGAVKRAYRDLVPSNRQPALVLRLNLDATLVDVNVHPSKSEVKFRDANMIHDFVLQTLRKALAQNSAFGSSPDVKALSEQAGASLVSSSSQCSVAEPGSVYTRPPQELELTVPTVFYHAEKKIRKNSSWLKGNADDNVKQERDINYEKGWEVALRDNALIKKIAQKEAQERVENNRVLQQQFMIADSAGKNTEDDSAATKEFLGKAICQLSQTYILAENSQGLIIVDAHAAHERITYEKLKHAYHQGKTLRQELVKPFIIPVSNKEAETVEEYSELLQRLGWSISRMSATSIAVRALPTLVQDANIEQLLHDVLASFSLEGKSDEQEACINAILATQACHNSIRAGRSLSIIEMNALLRAIETTAYSGQCAHGRPTWVQITHGDIKKLFGR